MTANAGTIRIRIQTNARPRGAGYVKRTIDAVWRWVENGQLGGPDDRDISRATGARC